MGEYHILSLWGGIFTSLTTSAYYLSLDSLYLFLFYISLYHIFLVLFSVYFISSQFVPLQAILSLGKIHLT